MSETQPKVSVIIPVYNTEKYLRECLDSVVNQTLRDIEIICVDDGSTDSSLAILQEYAERDDRFIILQQENTGAGTARNKGLDVAKGEYLYFLDSDDWCDITLLEKSYAKGFSMGADMVIFATYKLDMVTNELSTVPWEFRKENIPKNDPFSYNDMPDVIFDSFAVPAWNKLFSLGMIKSCNIRFQEQPRSNDRYFTCIALVCAEKITTVSENLIYHRRNVENSLQTANHLSPLCVINTEIAVMQKLREMGTYEDVKKSYLFTMMGNLHYYASRMTTFQSFSEFFYAVKNEIIAESAFLSYPKEFFSEKSFLYDWVKNIADFSLEMYLFNELNSSKKNEIDSLRYKLNRSYYDYNCIKKSFSFRVGRIITWLPRKLRGGIGCLKEHGLTYTFKRTLQHMHCIPQSVDLLAEEKMRRNKENAK